MVPAVTDGNGARAITNVPGSGGSAAVDVPMLGLDAGWSLGDGISSALQVEQLP